jgi:hypothetical protein
MTTTQAKLPNEYNDTQWSALSQDEQRASWLLVVDGLNAALGRLRSSDPWLMEKLRGLLDAMHEAEKKVANAT